MVKHIKQTHSQVQVLARAYDRGHLFELKDAGADFVIGETYNSALELAGEALKRMGMSASRVRRLKQEFTTIEQQHFDKLFHSWRNEGETVGFGEHFINLFMKIEEDLIKTMQSDHADKHSESETN